jgi:transcriptional regulator with XRE-family HTH domain
MDQKEKARLNLLRLMADRGWDEHKLSDAYGCAREYAIQLMTGKRNIGKGTLAKLIIVFKVDEEEFTIMPSDPEFWLNIHKIYKGPNIDALKEIVQVFAQAESGELDPEAVKILLIQAQLLQKRPS